jgi:hypothetical protein
VLDIPNGIWASALSIVIPAFSAIAINERALRGGGLEAFLKIRTGTFG